MAKALDWNDPRRKYSVGSSAGRSGHSATLQGAKLLGAKIAKQEAWRGKWNMAFLTIVIHKQEAPGSPYYKQTGWEMYVPVRGSGATAEHILAEIKRRKGVAPMKWVRRK